MAPLGCPIMLRQIGASLQHRFENRQPFFAGAL